MEIAQESQDKMMMIRRVYEVGGGFVSWARENGYMILFLTTQLAGVVMWGVRLDSRIAVIEQRGSPEVAALERRLITVEVKSDTAIARLTQIDGRLAELLAKQNFVDSRIATFEERDKSQTELLRDHNSKLDYIIQLFNKHLQEQSPPARNSR